MTLELKWIHSIVENEELLNDLHGLNFNLYTHSFSVQLIQKQF
jgi:hypothetical protein